jgi:hypothetical protein
MSPASKKNNREHREDTNQAAIGVSRRQQLVVQFENEVYEGVGNTVVCGLAPTGTSHRL